MRGPGEKSGGARDRHEEILAHDILAGDHLFGAAALLVEHHFRELAQRVARFVERAAVRIDSGELFDETDVAAVRFKVDSGEGNLSLFHSSLSSLRTQAYAKHLSVG